MTRSWPGLVAVVVTGASLAVAGRAGLPTSMPAGAGAPVEVGRTLVCPGGLPGARVESGTSALEASRGGRVEETPLPETPASAERVEVPPGQAAGVFASQVARTSAWLASTPCQEPRADWWFVGVGGSETHSSSLRIANPRDGDAVIDVTVYGPKGPVEAPGLRGLFVPAGSTKVLDLAEVAPAVGDLAVRVTTSRGLVSVVAADSFAPDLVGTPLREWVSPQPPSARNLLLTGLPTKPTGATLLVANPGEVEALVEVQVVGARGTFTPPANGTVRVPPGGVVPVPVTELFDGQPLALRLSSPERITATVRTTASADVAYAGAAGPVADGSALAVPDGLDAQVRVSAMAQAARVQVLAYDRTGKRLLARELEVAAASTAGLALPRGTRHVVLRSTSTGLAAGLVLQGRAGAGTGGAKGLGSAVFEAAVQAARTPEVRPG